jgi:hypothetical protein
VIVRGGIGYATNMDLSVACTLTEADMRERRATERGSGHRCLAVGGPNSMLFG